MVVTMLVLVSFDPMSLRTKSIFSDPSGGDFVTYDAKPLAPFRTQGEIFSQVLEQELLIMRN
jgi:hypothetical protein